MNAATASAVARAIRRMYPRRDVLVAAGEVQHTEVTASYAELYRNDSVGFLRNVLHFNPTPPQEQIALALPGRVKVNAGHSVGKTALAAALSLWWFYTRDPGIVITTAPTERDVIDLLWTEIRLLHARAGLPPFWSGPRAPEMFDHPEHWAKGYTARSGDSFQGRHRPSMFFIFDESEGISAPYWLTLNTMYQPDSDHCALAIGNPTTTSSQSYLEDLALGPDGKAKWKQFVLSSLDHPNIAAELKGEPRPIPHAVSLAQVNGWVAEWCTPIPKGAAQDLDFEWPPGSGIWQRPGPNFKARALGVRPTEGVDTVWSHKAFEEACRPRWEPRECWLRNCGISLGIDAGGYGDDDTAIHVRSGPLALHHESRNGWEPGQAAGRAKELIYEWTAWYNSLAELDRPPKTPADANVVLEFDGGYGVGVHSHRGEDFPNWYGIHVGGKSDVLNPLGFFVYANLRAELWFEGAAKARGGQMDLSRLPQGVLDKLRIQLVTPFYENLPNGTKRVEPKKMVKERLGRSPDDADALLVCHHEHVRWTPEVVGV